MPTDTPMSENNTLAECPYCDGTGDVHRADGEWLGSCDCPVPAPVIETTGGEDVAWSDDQAMQVWREACAARDKILALARISPLPAGSATQAAAAVIRKAFEAQASSVVEELKQAMSDLQWRLSAAGEVIAEQLSIRQQLEAELNHLKENKNESM